MLFSGMKLDYRFGQFVFECEYEERDIPKRARFWFDARNGQWISQSAKCAARLMEYATETARRRIWDKLTPGSDFTATFERSDYRRKRTGTRYRYNM